MNTNILKKLSYITILSLINSFLNFAFQMLIANRFGANIETDIFFLSYSIPEWIINITTFILPVTIIPSFSEQIALKNEKKAWNIAGSFITILSLILLLLLLLSVVFSDVIVNLIGKNYSLQYHEKIKQNLLLLLPTILFTSISWVLTGIYYSLDKYFIPIFSPIIQTLIMLFGVFVLSEKYGIIIAAYSILFGTLGQLLFLLLFLPQKKLKIILFKHDKEIISIFSLLGPLFIGNVIFKSEVIVNRYIASFLPAGSISILYYANKITRLLTRLTSKGVSTIFFPKFSKLYSVKDNKKLNYNIELSLKIVIAILSFLILFIIINGSNIIKFLFVSGSFSNNAAQKTYIALLFMLGVVFASPIGDIINNILFSMKDTKTVIKINLFLFVPGILLKIILTKSLSYKGIALSSSIITLLTIIILLNIINKKLKNLKFYELILSLGKKALLCLSCFIIVSIIVKILPDTTTKTEMLVDILIKTILLVSCYGVLGYFLKDEAILFLVFEIKKRYKYKKNK